MITEAIIASIIAGSSVCSDHFENVSRYNPTDLSDYQKCVHIVHENTSGVVGKNIWVNVNGDFFYIPVADVAGKTKSQYLTMVKAEIIKSVLADSIVNEKEVELRETLTQMPTLTEAQINSMIKAALEDVANKTEAELNAVFAGVDAASYDDLVDLFSFTNELETFANGVGTNSVDSYKKTYGDTTVLFEVDTTEGYSYVTFQYNSYQMFVGMSVNQYLNLADLLADVEAAGYEQGYEEGYKSGYSDGYDDGYKEGYANGFRDGVASVG